jgi:AcrR family transcriptional regulator
MAEHMSEVGDLKKEKRRRAIMRASLRVFARKGFDSASLEEVARESRLAKGTLYLYFKDKSDLYFHVMLCVFERLESYVEAQAVASGSVLERMAAVARAQIGFFARNPSYFRLFTIAFNPEMATAHRKLLGPFVEKRRRLGEYLHNLVEEGKSIGLIRGDIDSWDVVLSYMGMVNQAVRSVCMAQVGRKDGLGERRASPAKRTEAIMKILVQGIASATDGGHK